MSPVCSCVLRGPAQCSKGNDSTIGSALLSWGRSFFPVSLGLSSPTALGRARSAAGGSVLLRGHAHAPRLVSACPCPASDVLVNLWASFFPVRGGVATLC